MLVPILSRFLQWFPTGLAAPVLSLLLLDKGVGLDGLGFAWTVYAVVIVVLEVPTGVLADLIGRKRIFMLSLACLGAAYAAMLVARGFAAVAFAIALMALARALSSGSIEALYMDRHIESRGKDRIRELATAFGVVDPAALAAGAFLGGLIPQAWERLAPGSGRYDGNLVAMLVAILFHALLVGLAVRRDLPVRSESGARPSLRAFLAEGAAFVRGNRTFGWLLLAVAGWGLCFQAVELFWQPRLETILADPGKSWVFGLVSGGYFFAGLVGALLAPLLLRRGRPGPFGLIAAMRLLSGAAIALLALQGGSPGFAACYLGMFVLNGISNPPETEVLNRELPSAKRASLLSVYSLALQAGGGLGSLLFAQVAMRASIPAAWIGAGAALALSGLAYLAAGRSAARAGGAPAA